MKKSFKQIVVCLVIILISIIPCNVFAQTVNVDGTDVTITFGEEWHICTRDNPVCCYQVESLGITKEYMSKFFQDNSMYLNAGIIADLDNDGMDFFIIKDKTDFCEDLSKYTDTEAKEVAQGFAATLNCSVCEVYNGQHKFVYMEYVENNTNCIRYVTVYNWEYYTFTIQKAKAFTDEEKSDIKDIMESVVFGKPAISAKNNENENIWIIVGSVAAVTIISTVVIIIVKKK